MKHMKTNHIQHVSHCKNEETFCKYGFTKCWFIHKENIENAFKIARNIEPNINQNSIGKRDLTCRKLTKDMIVVFDMELKIKISNCANIPKNASIVDITYICANF